MSEWWTYRLSDFLMFSPAAYWRLVERYNREHWPLHVFMLGAGLLLLWLAAKRQPVARRAVAGGLAVIWSWVGWAFHKQAYAQINLAAEYFAAAFAVQAVLLLVFGVILPGDRHAHYWGRLIGWALAVLGLLFYPLITPLAGRPWDHVEVFGVMPEPTALATLGLLLATLGFRRFWLGIIPLLSWVTGVTTVWLLSS